MHAMYVFFKLLKTRISKDFFVCLEAKVASLNNWVKLVYLCRLDEKLFDPTVSFFPLLFNFLAVGANV